MKVLILIATFVGVALCAPNQCLVKHKVTGKQAAVDCNLDPETTEGPYYLPLYLHRSNIVESQLGLRFNINFVVMNTQTCQPINNATVDIWHASYDGKYSGYQAEGTIGQTWLRGIQYTNSAGEANFTSIFPGWYVGRCVHIHIEVYVGGNNNANRKHTGQLFFPDSTVQSMRSVSPYTQNTPTPMWNAQDGIYNGGNGASTTFELTGSPTTGWQATMYIGVNPNRSTTSTSSTTASSTTSSTTASSSTSSTTASSRPQHGKPSRG